MKLRNFVYAAMIACTFASCSKDDENVPTPDGGDANATLEVKIAAPATKALMDGAEATEKTINNLKLLVFNGTGADARLEVIGTVAGEAGQAESVMTPVTPGNKTVIILANVDLAKISTALTENRTTGTLYSDFLGYTMDFDNQESETGLSMNSKAFQVTVIASTKNYVGYTGKSIAGFDAPIKLYRNVAKIALTSVSTTRNDAQYPNAAIKLKNVYVLHAHKATKLVGAEAKEWGAINVTGAYFNGSENTAYKGWADYMTTGDYKKIMNFIPTATPSPYAYNASFVEGLGDAASLVAANSKYFYAYENTEANDTTTASKQYCTLLVVEADFSYDGLENGQTKRITEEGRFYPIAVGYGTANFSSEDLNAFKALRAGTDLSGVLRNLQYNVSLTITGPGYKTPFGPKPEGPDGPGPGGDTFLDAKVTVVGFGKVSQDETVE